MIFPSYGISPPPHGNALPISRSIAKFHPNFDRFSTTSPGRRGGSSGDAVRSPAAFVGQMLSSAAFFGSGVGVGDSVPSTFTHRRGWIFDWRMTKP